MYNQDMPSGKKSTTPYALLGLLSLGPGTGYDLKRRAESSVGHFWAENYGQIYPALKQMAAARLVTGATKPPRVVGRPARQVYSITAEGRAALKTWLTTTPRLEPFRSETLLKLFFGNVSGSDVQAAHLRRMREEEARRLTQYRAIEKSLQARHARAEGLPYWLMTLSYGRHRSQAVVAWIDETLARLARPDRARARA
jgi:DNA-binding PadR family transcriptional regulator